MEMHGVSCFPVKVGDVSNALSDHLEKWRKRRSCLSSTVFAFRSCLQAETKQKVNPGWIQLWDLDFLSAKG